MNGSEMMVVEVTTELASVYFALVFALAVSAIGIFCCTSFAAALRGSLARLGRRRLAAIVRRWTASPRRERRAYPFALGQDPWRLTSFTEAEPEEQRSRTTQRRRP
jgi:hypothetical protein